MFQIVWIGFAKNETVCGIYNSVPYAIYCPTSEVVSIVKGYLKRTFLRYYLRAFDNFKDMHDAFTYHVLAC